MKYTFIFLILGTYLIIISFKLGIVGWLLFWCGVSFLTLGAAYGWLGARVFGKGSDGKIAWWAMALLMPYLLLTWAIWHLQIRIGKEDSCNAIAPNIWLGRRPFVKDLPDNISLIVDLTAEFPESQKVIAGRNYICVPTLDAYVADDKTFRELIEKISSWQGNIYIHCALGHGRSATVAAATLVAKGLADNVDLAEEIIKKKRPGIEISKAQRRLLNRVFT